MYLPKIADQLIQLPSCDSTSNYVATAINDGVREYGLTVLTFSQTNGRGQRGNGWHCGEEKNIALSFFLNSRELKFPNLFYLNKICSLAVVDFVKHHLPKADVKIKWPNDVLVNEKKIAGILVESTFQGGNANYICGIGLNVNELDFPEELEVLATSIRAFVQEDLPLKNAFDEFMGEMNYYHRLLQMGNTSKIDAMYLESLLGLGTQREFEKDGIKFMAVVNGISPQGLLQLRAYDNTEMELLHPKEVKWVLKPLPLANGQR
jgi:BirA family biotin operon repressor/biotin-[acetyl-CoA-carboxylase] ligase